MLRHSTNSFDNKPLVVLDWSSKSRKRHRRSSSCGQSEKVGGKIFFYKEYYIWDCTHNIFFKNFNKYFVRIIFVIVLLTSQDQLRNLCTNFWHARWDLSASYLFWFEDWSLLRQWRPKELKLCMSIRAMTRSSLRNQHTTPLQALWLVARQNQHLHFQQNKQVSLLVC